MGGTEQVQPTDFPMNEEAANKTSEGAGTGDGASEATKTPPAKTEVKKVVSRVRDAKSSSSDRGPKAAPVDADRSDSDSAGEAKERAPREIKTVIEEAPKEAASRSNGREERRRPARNRRTARSSSQQSRSSEPVDPEELAKRAWKIFQSDVAEEGITLVDNSTGRQLALRSFELARVFLEEQARQTKLCSPSSEPKRRSTTQSGDQPAGSRDEEQKDEESSEGS